VGTLNEDRIHKHHDDERHLLAEILHTLRGILKQTPPRYTLSVKWNYTQPKGNSMSFFPKLSTPSLIVGQTVTGVITETETQNGVTTNIPPTNQVVSFDAPGIVSGVINPPDANGVVTVTLTALAAGTAVATVADSVNAAAGATASYSVPVAAAAPSFTENVAWGSPTP
jgi:hypothetical protein